MNDRGDDGPLGANTLDRWRAEEIALGHIGEGRVIDVSREDDWGAAWEIEVTRPDGAEADVYVNNRGDVVRTVERGRDDGDDGRDDMDSHDG